MQPQDLRHKIQFRVKYNGNWVDGMEIHFQIIFLNHNMAHSHPAETHY